MPRGSRPRTWIKLHVHGMLNGSVRYQLTPAQRSVWIDLLVLAALGPTPGIISDNDQRPYPVSFIANRLNVPLQLVKITLSQCEQEGRLTMSKNGIIINNWSAYQSEYERQRPYRLEKLQDDAQNNTTRVTSAVTIIGGDKNRIDVDVDKNRVEPDVAPPAPPPTAATAQDSAALATPTTDDRLKRVAAAYENEIGMISPSIGDKLQEAIDTYAIDWILEAFTLASAANARRWSYVEAILKRWKVEGKDNGAKPQKGQHGTDKETPTTDSTLRALRAALDYTPR